MKKLFAASILGLFVLTGCQNDDEQTVDLTPEEASAAINATADKMGDDIIALVESDGAHALLDFANLVEGSAVIGGRKSQKAWTKERLDLIIQYFVNGPAARTNNTEPTSFDEIKGLYEWNPETQDFDKEASEYFIVKFPTEGSETNNAELKISQLEFVTITEDHGEFVDQYELPTVIVGYVKVDDVTLIELDFAANWSSTGNPEEAEVSFFIKPFTFVLDFKNTFANKTSLLTSISIDDEVIVGIDVEVTFESDAKENPLEFEGYVQYRDLKIVGNVDLSEITDDSDPNDYINLDLYSGNSKLGNIIFELEEVAPGFNDYVPYVKYADGSTENLEEIMEPVLAEIEELFVEFEN